MEKYSIREVIEQAVQTERLGREFYSKMSERFAGDEKIAALFNELALKELEHERKFALLKDRIRDDMLENWDEASQYLRAIVESEFFMGNENALSNMDKVSTAMEAVNFAIGFEKETLLYYVGMRDSVSSDPVLDEIINEEKSHIRQLSEIKKNI